MSGRARAAGGAVRGHVRSLSMSYALATSRNFSAASFDASLSGWNLSASLRYALLTSDEVALRESASTS